MNLEQIWDQTNNQIIFHKLSSKAIIPSKGTTNSAGWDLASPHSYIVPTQSRILIGTQISVKLPPGTYGQIAPRSSLALAGIDIGGGIIDPDYEGEIKVILINNSLQEFHVAPNDRIAQLICVKFEPGQICTEYNHASFNTSFFGTRGHQGFGSTGK